MHSTYNTNDRRDTAILTSEIYYDIKEMNSFWGHLIKGNMANYICVDTAYSGTGDNVDTFFIQYSKNIKKSS